VNELPDNSPPVDPSEETRIIRFLDPSGPNFWCSVPLDTQAGRMLVFAAREGTSEQASKWINQTIRVENLLLHPVTFQKESGEVDDLIRAVMIQPDGQMIATCSAGIVSSLRTACQVFGRPPWNPCLSFVIRQLELKGGHRMYKLVPESIEVQAKEKKK